MDFNDFSDIDLVLYHRDKPISVCKPDYIGMLGMHVKVKNIFFPKDCDLEVEVLGPKKLALDSYRFPVVVSSSSSEGLGLRFQNFAPDLIGRWRLILGRILFYKKNGAYNDVANAI